MGEELSKRLRQTTELGVAGEAVLNLLVAADHVRARLNEACERHGITHAQYNVLRILRGAPSGHPRCEISNRLIERAPDVTRLIDRLEKQGFVERVRGTEDRRQSVTRITSEGLLLLSKVDPEVTAIQTDIETRLNAEDLQRISEFCERIYAQDES